MSRFAKVTSTDAVQRLAAALDSFKEEATTALDNLQLEVRRAVDWLRHDRKSYWDHEVRRGFQHVAEARVELERRMTFHSIDDYQPACRDEKLALERAKQKLRVAEQKVELVCRWSRAVEHELTEYSGAVNQLDSWLQADHPRAMADLKRMLAALESYLAMAVPAESRGPTASLQAASEEDNRPAEEDVQKPSPKPDEKPSPESSDDESMGS
jgi:hypothetical protein